MTEYLESYPKKLNSLHNYSQEDGRGKERDDSRRGAGILTLKVVLSVPASNGIPSHLML